MHLVWVEDAGEANEVVFFRRVRQRVLAIAVAVVQDVREVCRRTEREPLPLQEFIARRIFTVGGGQFAVFGRALGDQRVVGWPIECVVSLNLELARQVEELRNMRKEHRGCFTSTPSTDKPADCLGKEERCGRTRRVDADGQAWHIHAL